MELCHLSIPVCKYLIFYRVLAYDPGLYRPAFERRRASMTWNLFGQSLNVALACILVYRLFSLQLYRNYWALLAFVIFQTFQSTVYILLRLFGSGGIVDYRLLWSAERVIYWIFTLWLIYALMRAILKQLPGILQFSLKVLNITFVTAAAIALLTVRPEYSLSASSLASYWSDWRVRLVSLVIVLHRAISFAELLSILAILIFFLRFPVRVPKNLATLSMGLSITLFLDISLLLLRTYLPSLYPQMSLDPFSFISAACLTYWALSLNPAGQETQVTLGRSWNAVPREKLVLQLEAINAALLHSRKS